MMRGVGTRTRRLPEDSVAANKKPFRENCFYVQIFCPRQSDPGYCNTLRLQKTTNMNNYTKTTKCLRNLEVSKIMKLVAVNLNQ